MILSSSEIDAIIPFERFGVGQCQLVAIARDTITDTDLKKIVSICNQPKVKNWVTYQYATGPNGQYTIQDAKDYVELATNNWFNREAYSYLVRNEDREIVGAMGLKSPENNTAEVGYWADGEGKRGYMTNALIELCKVAKKAGFKELYAQVVPGNESSKNLSVRAGFIEQPDHVYIEKHDKKLLKFVKKLD